MQYEHSTATVVREGLASCLLAWVLSPRWAACGLAPVWLGSALLSLSLSIPPCLALPCRSRPPLAKLCKAETHKTPRGQSASFRVPASGESCVLTALCYWRWSRYLLLVSFRSRPGGRDRYYVVHMRWAVPCLQLRIVRRASITMYCSTLQWFFYWHVVSAFVRRRMHCPALPWRENNA